MLNPILSLMESFTLKGFEKVVVEIVPGILHGDCRNPLPSVVSMELLRHRLENLMGTAQSYAGDEYRMEICPRLLADTRSKQLRGGEATRARSRAVILRHRRRAKRGLRNLLKG